MSRFWSVIILTILHTSIFSQEHGVIVGIRDPLQEGSVRSEIWKENFVNGIPSSWTAEEAGGIANWEYRGLSTSPDLDIGNRGSCALSGTAGRIDSPTVLNGFVIFDSNWWDAPEPPCSESAFGTGPAPGPHLAILTSPVINLSAYPNIALRFNQFYRNYQSQAYVQVSADGGMNWQTVFNNVTHPLAGTRNDVVQIPLSNVLGGNANARIRFVFEGLGYSWQLDDISLLDIFENDLKLETASYAPFSPQLSAAQQDYSTLEYTKYPDELAPLLRLSGVVNNVGSQEASGAKLNVKIKQVSNQNILFNESSVTGQTIDSGVMDTLYAPDLQMPAIKGKYEVEFEVFQDVSDEFVTDNKQTKSFSITDAVYARDEGFTTSVYVPSGSFSTTPYEVGNIFYVPTEGLKCYSVSVAIAAGTSTPGTFYAALYEFEYNETPQATLLGITPNAEVTGEMVNAYGQSKLVQLAFDMPIDLQAGKTYYAVAGTPDGGEQVVFALSGNAPILTSWVKYSTGQYFYIGKTPMVRMNFAAVIEEETGQAFVPPISVYPNPTSGQISFSAASWQDKSLNIKITDVTGRLIYDENIDKVSELLMTRTIDFPATGMYVIRLSSEGEEVVYKVVKE